MAAGGLAAPASKGAGGVRCRLSPAHLRELEAVLEAGPAASGWDQDQCWTLARVTEVIWFAAVAAEAGPGQTIAVAGDGAVGLLGAPGPIRCATEVTHKWLHSHKLGVSTG